MIRGMNLPVYSRFFAGVLGVVWCWLCPTLPFIFICVLAVLIDCITAWRLNRRIRRYYTKDVADGKLKSAHMSKMIGDLAMVFLCIILAYHIDTTILAHLNGLHLANYVAVLFCATQVVSILENESSCNGATWALLAQRVLADKTKRHIKIDITEFNKLRREYEEKKENQAKDDVQI